MKRKTPVRALALLLVLLMLLAGCRENEQQLPDQAGSASPDTADAGNDTEDREASRPDPDPVVEAVEHGDFLWMVEDEETGATVYLLGTMHVLRDNYLLNDRVIELYNASDALAVESDVMDNSSMMSTAALLIYQDDSLQNHLSDYGYNYLEKMAAMYDLNMELLNMLRPYGISSMFSLQVCEDEGFSTEGVDMKLLQMAYDEGKTILELEEAEDLYIKFNTMVDDDTMERICILTIPTPGEMAEDLEYMYNLYLTGDPNLMYEYLMTEVEYPHIEFEEKDYLYNYYMLTERNEIMAESILSYLETPDQTVFVAAGLAHFLGEDSIIDILFGQGYTIHQL